MDTASIIAQIDAEISHLQQAKAILSGTDVEKPIGRPKATQRTSKSVAAKPAKRVMSAEGKARIAKAQKARWAKVKSATKATKATKKIASQTSTV